MPVDRMIARARKRWVAHCSVALVPLLWVGQAAAADDRKGSARAHFERGIQLADSGALDLAVREFKRAYQLEPHYAVLFNLGQEGNNLEGRSILRAAYKHWYIKDELEQIMSIAARDLEPPGKSLERMLLCPGCLESMASFHYPQTLVVVDMCQACGSLWLDGGELKEIRAIRTGLRKQGRLEEYAPARGIKGALLRFIDWAIDRLGFWS